MNREVKVKVKGYDVVQEVAFEYKFNCIELQEAGAHYGNGKHIHIVKEDGTSWKYIDVRYEMDYDFIDFLRREFESHYGANLRQLEMFLEETSYFDICVFSRKYNEEEETYAV